MALNPGDEGEEREDLRLDLQGDVEGLHDVVDAERHAGPGPPHHHGGLQAGGVVAAVVDDYLGDELLCVSGMSYILLLTKISPPEWTSRPV